jgi:stearoyl-CoA desaturase (delta-9 desaturase)
MSAAPPPATDDAPQGHGLPGTVAAQPADNSSRAGGAARADESEPGGARPLDAPAVEHEAVANIDRIVTAVITALPVLLLGLAAWKSWDRELGWRDVAIFLVLYLATGLGVTVGFHRLLTHRSFKTSGPVRFVLAVMGTMSIEGPVISWVADHRRHHAYTDRPGDPHSPHVDHGRGLGGALKGLAHAHVGWLFERVGHGSREHFAPDLIADPVVAFVDRTFIVWSLLGLALPFLLGFALSGGSLVGGGLSALLWAGLVRIFLVHHITWSINSICHFFGRRRFETDDESTNVFWLALPSLGEAWHHNHHAFPRSAFHGLRWYELDPSGWLILGMEKVGLAWDVVKVSPERAADKLAARPRPRVPAG